MVKNDIGQLLPKEPGELWSYIWSLKDKTSHWFRLKDENVLSYIDKRKNDSDMYLAVSLFQNKKSAKERGKANESAGIFGLWLDVDIKTPTRGKSNLPESVDDAMLIINSGEIEPSLIINSGYGLQAWWLFEHPWIFENDQERSQAAALAQSWVAYYSEKASKHGWALDNVSDLARIMRAPGTLNFKGPVPVEVSVVQNSGKRYSVEELSKIVKDVDCSKNDSEKKEIKSDDINIVVNENASFPMKFAYMCSNMKNFLETWSHDRRIPDSSMSGYDMAIAMYGVLAGLSDQEICDLLVCHAKEHGYQIKPKHYYEVTISKARNAKAPMEASEIIPKLKELNAEGREGVYAKREEVFGLLSSLLNIPIKNFIAYKTIPREYELITDYGKVEFYKGQEDLVSSTAFRKRVGDITRTYPPRFKADKWDIILQALSYAVEEIDVGEDVSDEAQTLSWINDYLDSHPPFSEGQMAYAVESRKPFRRGDKVCFWLDDFRRWLMSNGEKMSLQSLGARLKRIGADSKIAKHDRKSIRVWEIEVEDEASE